MRRPILIIFFFFAIFIVLVNNCNDNIEYKNAQTVSVSGSIKNIKVKKYYDYICVGNFILKVNKNHNLQVGDYVSAVGKLQNLDDLKIEQFDYGLYLKSIGYRAIIDSADVNVIKKQNTIYKYAYDIRIFIIDAIDEVYRSNSSFVSALLIGTDTNIKTNEYFIRTGTAHIMALSGYNVAIVAGMIFLILRKINNLYKFAILNLILMIYCIVGQMSPSVIRASMMLSLFFLAIFIEREYDNICALSSLGIIFIILNSYIIYNVSFLLSFSATASILIFYKRIDEKIKYPVVSMSLSSYILTFPITVYAFKGTSLIFLIANMLIVPFVGVLTILLIISLFLFWFNIKIYFVISLVCNYIIEYIFFICEKLSVLEFAYIKIENVNIFVVIIYYACIIIYVMSKEIKKVKEQTNELCAYNKRYKRWKV